jgi:hypothetical protein
MVYQTAIQNSKTLRFGSAKIEVGADVGTLTNLGIASDVEFTEEFKTNSLKPDNAPEEINWISEQTATAKFNLWEMNLTNLNMIRGGIDTLTTTPSGSPVTTTDELHVLTGVVGTRLLLKNSTGAIATTISVKDSANGSCVLNTDYYVYVDGDGYTCIARNGTSATIITGEQVKVTYTVTPAASVKITSGGKSSISTRVVRLTNLNASGQKFQITVFAARNQKGIELKLPADDDDTVMMTEVELKGTCDPTLAIGAQLFEIIDEQGV